MSNGISSRQNEEQSIAMLGAQRQLYNDAKVADTIKIWFSVLIPFILSFVLLIVSEDSLWCTLSYTVSLLSVIVSSFIGKHIKKKKELAAAIQQQFDVYVYDMPWNDRLFGKRKNLNPDIAEHSKRLFSKAGEREHLSNWYPDSVDSKTLENGILTCQSENCWWDVGLRKRYKIFSIVVIIVMTAVILFLGIFTNESLATFLWRLAFIAPMVQWLIDTINSLDDDMENLSEISDALNDSTELQMYELQEIQKMILDHRKGCLAIPNVVYCLFKGNDEDKAHRVAAMR